MINEKKKKLNFNCITLIYRPKTIYEMELTEKRKVLFAICFLSNNKIN